MSTSVVGFRPPDDKWQRMKAAYDACQAAGVAPPEELDEFFDGSPPDDAGVEVRLTQAHGVEPYAADSCSGFQVDLTKLPAGLKYVRFVNSW